MRKDQGIVRYWGRKPAALARRYISRYSSTDDTVLDAFGGSGVFVKTALDLGRRAVYIDLNPFAKLIASSTISECSVSAYGEAVQKILSRRLLRIRRGGKSHVVRRMDLFTIKCTCGRSVEIELIGFTRTYILLKNMVGITGPVTTKVANIFENRRTITHPELLSNLGGIRSSSVSYVVSLLIKKGFLSQLESASIASLKTPCKCGRRIINLQNRRRIWIEESPLSTPLWHPRDKLRYSTKKSFLKKRDVESVDQFFLDRTLVSLSQIWHDIDVLKVDQRVKKCLQATFMATLARASKMNRLNGGTWPINSYWIPRDFVSRNPYFVFERAAKHVTHLLEKSRSVKIGTLSNVIEKKADITFLQADSTRVKLPANSIDYVIMDPPHTDEAQFLELSLFYTAWMKAKLDFGGELVINARQDKSLKRYISMIQTMSTRIYHALKSGGYLTAILHEEDFSILVSCSAAIRKSGFELVRQNSDGDYSTYTFRKPRTAKS